MVIDWWSASEIANACLPDLPATKRGVARLIEREGWNQSDLMRRRTGAGGGLEYHRVLFPTRAQMELLRRRNEAEPQIPEVRELMRDRDAAWEFYQKVPEKVRREAIARLNAIDAVESLESGGETRNRAVTLAAEIVGKSPRAIWGWLKLIEDVRRDDRLAYLVPKHRQATRNAPKAACAPEAWERFKTFYLRPEKMTMREAHRQTARLAEANGWEWPPYRTIARRVEREIPRSTAVLARDGRAALRERLPKQIRAKQDLHAMEVVNTDGHRWDVMVKWPDGTVARPTSVAFQDIHSGRILSVRHALAENKLTVLGAFSDMIRAHGIPDNVVCDNGRAFASKWLTGGTPTRFRFKVKDDEPEGVLTKLGVRVFWTKPYSGRSKPIERAFRDWASDIAKDIRFSGAYCGNRPDAKPENYGQNAVPFEHFCRVVAERVAEINAREERRSRVCNGRSFDQAFAASIESAPVRVATEQQCQMCLMAVQQLTPAHDGRIWFQGNGYDGDFLFDYARRRVTCRFDPDNLRAGLWVETLDGRALGFARCVEAVGFLDMEAARTHEKAISRRMKAEAEALKAHLTVTKLELAREMDAIGGHETPDFPAPKVVRPIFAGPAAAASAQADPEFDFDQVQDIRMRGVLRLVGSEE